MGAAYTAAAHVMQAFENKDTASVRPWLADNFTFHDPASPMGPINADQWLGMNDLLFQAFPDFTFNFQIEGEEGNQVWVSAQFEGTHTGDFDLSSVGMGVIPATGNAVLSSRSTTRGVINASGKVESIEVVEQDENGGMAGLLRQIGVNPG